MNAPKHGQTYITLTIAFAFFMEAVDSTVLNTAIPSMSQSLHVNPIDLKIALISYLLSLAIFIPISGWLADKYGAKRMFLVGLCVFTLSSLWCGFATTLLDIVTGRFVQGLGGALNLPIGRLMILRAFGQQKMISQMNRVVTIGSLGLMLGPFIGGYLTHHFSWPWIFWINLPIGLITILLVMLQLPADTPKSVHPLDKIGFILFGLSLCGLTLGLSLYSESSMQQHAFTILCTSLCLLVLYIIYAKKQPYPIVNAALFGIKTFRLTSIGSFLSRFGFSGIPFLVPLLLQTVLKYNPEASGALLIPIAMGVLLSKRYCIWALQRLGFKYLLVGNSILLSVSILCFSMIGPNTSLLFIISGTFCYGFLTSMQFSGLNALVYADLPETSLSAATSITATIQQLSQSMGVAISALCLVTFAKHPNQLTLVMFHKTFDVLALLTLIPILIFLRLHHQDGKRMISSE